MKLRLMTLASLALACVSQAAPSGLLLGKLSGESAFDKAWSAMTLYKDEENPILQSFALQGRFQLQNFTGHYVGRDNSDMSDYKEQAKKDADVYGNDWEARRFRLGFKSQWFKVLKVDMSADINPDFGPVYSDMNELYAVYQLSDNLSIGAGKYKVRFGVEHETSSNNLITIERSLVTNMLESGELTGIWYHQKGLVDGNVGVKFELYKNDDQRLFSYMDSKCGELLLAKVDYDLSSKIGFETAKVGMHYLYNNEPGFKGDRNPRDWYGVKSTKNYDHAVALTTDLGQGRFGFVSDLMFADGKDVGAKQGNIASLMVMPSYYLCDGLQLVTRLQYAESNKRDGITSASRYQDYSGLPGATSSRKGDTYKAAYVGLNYYIYGHKLKLTSGIEYSKLNGGVGAHAVGREGYAFMNGLRMSF